MQAHPRCQRLFHPFKSSCPDCEVWDALERAKYAPSGGTRLLSGVQVVRPGADVAEDHERRLRALELHANGDVELSGNARQLHVYKNGGVAP